VRALFLAERFRDVLFQRCGDVHKLTLRVRAIKIERNGKVRKPRGKCQNRTFVCRGALWFQSARAQRERNKRDREEREERTFLLGTASMTVPNPPVPEEESAESLILLQRERKRVWGNSFF
jgi:hypothetical protein